MKMKKDVLSKIISHAKREVPIEACGYLAGYNGVITDVFEMKNADMSPEHFTFDVKEQFKTVKAARTEGLEITAIYHSHPHSPARMSQEDVRLANDKSKHYVIYSIYENEIKCYKFNDNENIIEEDVELI